MNTDMKLAEIIKKYFFIGRHLQVRINTLLKPSFLNNDIKE